VAAGAEDGEPPVVAGVLRWLTLLACLGPEVRGHVELDQVIALLAGLPSPPSPGRLATAAAAVAAWRDERRPGLAGPAAGWSADGLDVAPLVGAVRVRRVVAALAGAVLAAFARRLPGFSDSSMGYLRRNFLLGPALVRWDNDGVRAELPAVPLAVVLRMAGSAHRRWTVGWLPGGALDLEGDAP
jgi:hypothetical protein